MAYSIRGFGLCSVSMLLLAYHDEEHWTRTMDLVKKEMGHRFYRALQGSVPTDLKTHGPLVDN